MKALRLRDIITLSIKLLNFPEESKINKLKPIFRKGARTERKNYQPISLLLLVSKIIEKSIHSQIEDYLNTKKLIYMYQSGFSLLQSFLSGSVDRIYFNWYE